MDLLKMRYHVAASASASTQAHAERPRMATLEPATSRPVGDQLEVLQQILHMEAFD